MRKGTPKILYPSYLSIIFHDMSEILHQIIGNFSYIIEYMSFILN